MTQEDLDCCPLCGRLLQLEAGDREPRDTGSDDDPDRFACHRCNDESVDRVLAPFTVIDDFGEKGDAEAVATARRVFSSREGDLQWHDLRRAARNRWSVLDDESDDSVIAQRVRKWLEDERRHRPELQRPLVPVTTVIELLQGDTAASTEANRVNPAELSGNVHEDQAVDHGAADEIVDIPGHRARPKKPPVSIDATKEELLRRALERRHIDGDEDEKSTHFSTRKLSEACGTTESERLRVSESTVRRFLDQTFGGNVGYRAAVRDGIVGYFLKGPREAGWTAKNIDQSKLVELLQDDGTLAKPVRPRRRQSMDDD